MSMKNYFMQTWLCCLLMVGGVHVTSAQGIEYNGQLVRGVILDKDSKAPIQDAHIELLNHSPLITSVSGLYGLFEMENIPVGRQRIRIEREGYYETVLTILVDAGKELVLDIPMEELYEAPTPTEQKKETIERLRNAKVAPANNMTNVSYRSFSVEEVLRYPGAWEDPARLMVNFPGLYNVDDTQNYIVSRGASPFGLRSEIEGVPIGNPNHLGRLSNSGGIFPLINNNVIANSDFVNGAFSAEYGNATSGIFDISLRSGNNRNFEFTGEVSLLGAKAVIEGPFKKGGASFIIAYRYSIFDLMRLIGLDVNSTASPSYQDLNFKIDIPTKNAGSFSIFGVGGISDVQFDGENIDPNDAFAKDLVNISTHTETGLLGAIHKVFLGKNSQLKTTISYLYENYTTNQDSIDAFSRSLIPYFDAYVLRHRVGVRTTLNSKVSNRLTTRAGIYGYGYLFNILNEDQLINQISLRSDDMLFRVGGFAQMRFQVSRRFFINLGVHGQYFNLNNRSWSAEPRLSFNWLIGKRHQLSLGYGWHSQMQPLAIAFYVEPNPNDNTLNTSNRDLGFMRSHHGVLSYNVYLAQNWELKANAYMQYHTNIPVEQLPSSFSVFNFGVYEAPMVTNLVDNGLAYNAGGELSLEKFFSKGYHGVFGASYFRSFYQGSDGVWRNSAFDVQYILQLVLGKEFKIGRKKRNAISIDVRVNHHGGGPYNEILLEESVNAGYEVRDLDNPYTERYDPYTRVDIKLGATFNPPKKKISHYIYFDIINVGLFANDRQAKYNPILQQIEMTRQFGLVPNIFYRIRF